MSSWGPITYTVGSSPSAFPMAIFKAIGAVTVKFTLTSAQTGARTLKIGTTLAFAGGRPQVKVNSWTSAAPAAPSQPDSRGVTRGTYRGNVSGVPAGSPRTWLLIGGVLLQNIEYTYAIREWTSFTRPCATPDGRSFRTQRPARSPLAPTRLLSTLSPARTGICS